METDNKIVSDTIDDIFILNNPPIYSRNSIRGFSILLSPVFGGVMLSQNLKDIGNRKAASKVLVFSILYTIASLAFSKLFNDSSSSMSLIINIIGSLILSDFYFGKYFPEEKNYPVKKIWKPLIIAFVILTVLFFLAFYVLRFGQF